MESVLLRTAIVCFVTAVLTAPGSHAQADGRRYPHELTWSDTETRRIRALATTIRKAEDGYWTTERTGVRVRTSVSAELAAEAICYAEPLMRAFPKAMGLSSLRKRVRFVFAFHETEDQFRQASGSSDAAGGYGRIRSEDGEAFTAEIHLCADGGTGTKPSDALGRRVDLGVLQYRFARALLHLYCAPDCRVPPFLREGCATYFENFNTRNNRRSSSRKQAVRVARPSFRRALNAAMLEESDFQPRLFDALHQSAEDFDGNAEMNGALADSFVDFLLTGSRHRSKLPKLLARAMQKSTDDGGHIMAPEEAADLESEWHRHLCLVVAHSLPVQHADLPVNGNPPGMPSVTKLSRYGSKPLVSVMAAEKGAFDVAWYDGAARTIRILKCDAEKRKLGEVSPSFIENANALLGAARLPGSKGYAVGYSKDNEHGDRGFEFWIARFGPEGDKMSETRIFGEKKSDELWAKGGPGGAGTARIVYNEKTGKIGFYLSHNMKWKDGVRHQGGYVGFLHEDGKQLMRGDKPLGNGWYFSHNFDQRLIVANGAYYALAHGDAFPRALGFSKWTDGGGKALLVNARYHEIPGESGDNTTHCQTGGLAPLSDSTFAVLYASSNDRPSHDVCIKVIDDRGSVAREKWLTSYPAGQHGAYPRIARYGDDVLLAWEEVGGQRAGATLQLMVVDSSLETVFRRVPVDDVHVSPYCDLIALDDGAIVWALPIGGREIRVCRIDRPNVLEARLLKLMEARRTRRANRKRTPKAAAVEGIDRKMILKLSELEADGDLLGGAVRLSIARSPVRLREADATGSLTFAAATGRKTASFSYADLPFADRAALALALYRLEPDNRTLYGVAGFYLDCAGDASKARACYDRAGRDVAAKFSAFFERE